MYNFLIITNLVLSISTTQVANFNVLYNNLSVDEQIIITENNIDSYEELDLYLYNESLTKSDSSSSNGNSSDSIRATVLKTELESKYPDYTWFTAENATTKLVSNNIPINMQGTNFPSSDIQTAIIKTEVKSSYGGCGPIAMMGMIDYFSRYLGYTELIADPTSSSDRVDLACDVLDAVKTYEVGFSTNKGTLTFPWDYENGFNNLMEKYGVSDIISAKHQWKLLEGKQVEYWDTIVENVNKGIPVTLMTGLFSGGGNFAEHYTNIYGYETWMGYDSETGDIMELDFIRGRLNWDGYDYEYCCSADILNDGMIGLITYEINYDESYSIYASDFAEEFVNDSGGGQYFFYNIAEPVSTSTGRMIYTNRLRCSYIENQYLVLSPNRAGAGTAYLDILLPHSASKITFDASMWSSLEGAIYENFKIQYYKNDQWYDHVTFDLNEFSTLKDYPNTYSVLLPKDVLQFRFYAEHSNPTGDRNKGRIVLDNIKFEYNL